MASIEDYLRLIPSANRDKPRFLAVMAAILSPYVEIQNVALQIPQEYDLDSAVGKQLDVVGQWIGFSRRLSVPVEGVYFSFDTDSVGWDEGIWRQVGDPLDGVSELDDGTYRLVLKVKAMANRWDGSLEDANTILGALSPEGTCLFIQDNFDMTMSAGLSGIVPGTLFKKIIQTVVEFVRPETVGLREGIITSENGTPLFGFDVGNGYIGGWDTGSWGTVEELYG